MYSVLVVDDFLADRMRLIHMLRTLTDLDIQIIGGVENGREAMKLIAQQEPNIVITDVEMPVCDGFELSKFIRVHHPQTRIIFCSFYDAFDYAKKAVFLGSYGYLLKPVDKGELKQCLQNVIRNINSEAMLLERSEEYDRVKETLALYKPAMARHFLYTLLMGMADERDDMINKHAEYLDIFLQANAFYRLLYIEIDDYIRAVAAASHEQREMLSMKIAARIDEILPVAKNHILVRMNESHFACILQSPKRDRKALGQTVIDCCDRLLTGFRKSDLSITIAVSETGDGVGALRNLYETCASLIRYKFILGGDKIIRVGDVPFESAEADINYNLMIKDVRRLLNSCNTEDIDAYLDTALPIVPVYSDQVFKSTCFMLLACVQIIISENNESLSGIAAPDMLALENLNSFETALSQKEWIGKIFYAVNVRLAEKSMTKNRQMVKNIKDYLDENYVKNINMDDIAASMYYSANYLNRIFKQETGETIYDYATKLRIEKAKEMLGDPRNKLYEISEALGYNNSAYFSGVFKKHTGVTPTEYRERIAT